jgi:hypothetical protein
VIEAQRVASLVWDLLRADTGAGGVSALVGARIYRDVVPQAALLPAVTVTLVSATDTNTLGARRVFANTLVDVRVVSDGSVYGNAIADRIDTVLQNVGGLKDTVHVVELRRESVQAFVENDSGKLYAHLISTYRSEAYA